MARSWKLFRSTSSCRENGKIHPELPYLANFLPEISPSRIIAGYHWEGQEARCLQGFTVPLCCVHFRAGDTEAHQEKPLWEGAATLTARLPCQSRGVPLSPRQDSGPLLSELNTVGHKCGCLFPC